MDETKAGETREAKNEGQAMPPPPRLPPDDEHNRALLSAVHPADWVNPSPASRYDLVVVGAGTAGLITALGGVGLGKRVALVERHLMGGDCLNVGCVPSKALIRSARAAAELKEAEAFGVRLDAASVQVDFGAVMERMRRLRAGIAPHDGAARFREAGIDVFLGQGRFVAGDALEVAGQRLNFKKACIATGARAAAPPIPGLETLDKADVLTNESVFSLTDLPKRLAVIGAGPIGCELAQAFARFGSKVSLIEAAHGVLPREDRDAAAFVEARLRSDGVEVLCCGKKTELTQGVDGVQLTLGSHEQRFEKTVDKLLIAVGRAPNVEGLGLEAAGVAYTRKGVQVDDHLRTTNARIFAAGDICSRYQFTHAADALARIVVRNALLPYLPFKARASRLVMPWVTYSDPEIAHVGAYGHELAEAGVAHRTVEIALGDIDRAILDGETGLLKVHVRRNGQILGATLVSRHAGESLGELTTAMVYKIPLQKLSSVIHPYPTQAEVIKRAADQYFKTHLYDLRDDLTHPWRLLGIGRPPLELS